VEDNGSWKVLLSLCSECLYALSLPRGTRVKYVDCAKKEQQITTTETDSMVLETASDWEIIWFPFNLFQMVAGVFPLG
jgi:hypothetical protein